MNDCEFGAKLKSLRTSAGKTVPETSTYLRSLGHRASEKTIYGWERGHSQPAPDVFLDLCKFYDVKDILLAFGYKLDSPESLANDFESDERQLVEDYRSLNEQGKEVVRQHMELMIESSRYKKSCDVPNVGNEA